MWIPDTIRYNVESAATVLCCCYFGIIRAAWNNSTSTKWFHKDWFINKASLFSSKKKVSMSISTILYFIYQAVILWYFMCSHSMFGNVYLSVWFLNICLYEYFHSCYNILKLLKYKDKNIHIYEPTNNYRITTLSTLEEWMIINICISQNYLNTESLS